MHNEVAALQKYMPPGEYCIIHITEENIWCGVISDEHHSKFIDILSGETLEQLEYLDEDEFRNIIKDKQFSVVGNRDLFLL
ncbi:MAG TPA: hypothetical protein VM101_02000 [Flavitalea sp.]|nr:hypothetical protein [Flavitalea sp.]